MKKILILIVTSLLTSCETVYVDNYCLFSKEIKASEEDKKALKQSTVSKDFILQITNHNDFYKKRCLNTNLKE